MGMPADRLAEVRRAFDSCDVNGSGLIDHHEFCRLLRMLDDDTSDEECELDFAAIDSDGDGQITFEEFAAWWLG